MVTCHAITISPAGAPWPMAGAAAPEPSAAAMIHTSGRSESRSASRGWDRFMVASQRAPARGTSALVRGADAIEPPEQDGPHQLAAGTTERRAHRHPLHRAHEARR